MAVNIVIQVEDVEVKLLTYTQIEIERANTVDGSYVLQTTLNLVSGTYFYLFTDSSGDLNKWYRHRFHNPSGPVNSEYSAPYQVSGATRLKIRQRAITTYRCGAVLIASGGDNNSIITTDARFANSNFAVGRGRGGWTMPTTGARIGEVGNILPTSNPATGTFEISPNMTGAIGASDEFEWHWLTSPGEWNEAINRGLQRYSFIDRVPVKGVGTVEISLTNLLPWLKTRRDIHGIWWYPQGAELEEAFGSQGRWWEVRQDREAFYLMTWPALAVGELVYIECWRPTPEVFTDSSVLPPATDIDLAAALAYDEVLANLLRPGDAGASIDKARWTAERVQHQRRLKALARTRMPRPRYQQPQLAEPARFPAAWSAR